MSNYNPVYTSIWSDIKFTEFTPEQQLIFLYLITNKNCKVSGIYQVSPKEISFSTNIDKNLVIDSLKSYDVDTLDYDAAAGIVFIKNHFKYNMNQIGNPKVMISSLLKNSELVSHPTFWDAFIVKYNDDIGRLMLKIKDFKANNSTLSQHLANTYLSVSQHLAKSYVEVEVEVEDTINNKEVKKRKKFIKPILEEIKTYCSERKNSVDADKFINYYDSNGWKVGRNPMKSWQAAIRTWEKSSFDKPTKITTELSTTQKAALRFEQRAANQIEGGENDTLRIL